MEGENENRRPLGHPTSHRGWRPLGSSFPKGWGLFTSSVPILAQRVKGRSEAMGICHLTTFPLAQRAKGRGRFIIWGWGVSWGGVDRGRDKRHTWVFQCTFLVANIPHSCYAYCSLLLSFIVLLPLFAALPSLFVSSSSVLFSFVAVLVYCKSISTPCPPCEQWLAAVGAGAVVIVVIASILCYLHGAVIPRWWWHWPEFMFLQWWLMCREIQQ
jgi:hypothetical protein